GRIAYAPTEPAHARRRQCHAPVLFLLRLSQASIVSRPGAARAVVVSDWPWVHRQGHTCFRARRPDVRPRPRALTRVPTSGQPAHLHHTYRSPPPLHARGWPG